MIEEEMTEAESAIEDFTEVACNVDRLAKMFKLRRKIYTADDLEKLRREYFPAFYKRRERAGSIAVNELNQAEIEKMDLQVARDLGRRDPFECQARLALDPYDRRGELWIFSENYVSEAESKPDGKTWTGDESSRLEIELDELIHVWNCMFDEVAAYAPGLETASKTKAAFDAMFASYRRRILGNASAADVAGYPKAHARFLAELKTLGKSLADHIVIDGDKLDYGEVSRIELGQYSFEDVYADSNGKFGYERAGRLFYIKDNGLRRPYVNQYLLSFDEQRLESVRQLELQYNTFRKLMSEGRREEALEHLPLEDAECEMGGVVMKIRKAIEDLKIFARDSVDKFGTIRNEAFQQFKYNASSTILGENFDVMRADWYRNLGYVSGTDSKFAVIREPLYFLNECWDGLFRWLVRDMKCRFFERAWDTWTRYKDYCWDAGCACPWEDAEEPSVAVRIDALELKMREAFDDLSEKRLPRFSSEPVDVGTIARDIRSLLEDGSPFLNPTAESRLGVCLEKLTLITKACIQRQQWGMLGNIPFIRMTVMMADIEELEIYKDDGMLMAVKWANLRNTLDAYLTLLGAKIQCRKIRTFQDWLSDHRKITIEIQDSSIRVSIDPDVVTEFREMCRDVAVSICIPDQVAALREEYAGNIGWMCEDDDYLELRKPTDIKKRLNATKLAAIARGPSPFFATKTASQLKREEQAKELFDLNLSDQVEYVEPTITDEQLLELGGDRRVIDYLNEDPIACWRYPYYEYLCLRKEYLQAGFAVSQEAEEHLVAFLITSLDEYDHEFASKFDGEELQFQIERHDSYKQKYIYDVYGRLREEMAEREGAKAAAAAEQARLNRDESLRAEGRIQGVKAAVGLLSPDGKVHAIVDGYSTEGHRQAVQISNSEAPISGLLSNVNLARLFGVHVNTIANWHKGAASPEGFKEAYKNRDYDGLIASATLYRAKKGKCDVFNVKGLIRGISEEQIHREKVEV